MVLRTQSGPATLSSQGALLPRGSVLTPRSPGCSLGGATGTGHGSGLHSGHDKEPFSSGTSRHSEPPSAHGTRLPHSRPSQWPAVRLRCGPNCSPVWAHSGAWAGPAQAKRGARSFCPRGERSLEPCREGEGDQAPWCLQGSHRPSHRGGPQAPGREQGAAFHPGSPAGSQQAPKPLQVSASSLENGKPQHPVQSWLQGGSEGERGCDVYKTPQHRCPKTNSGRRAGRGAPLPPPDYTAHQDILPRVGLARGHHATCRGGWMGAHKCQCSSGQSSAGPGMGHSVTMAGPTPGREPSWGDGQTPQAQPHQTRPLTAPSTTPTSSSPQKAVPTALPRAC